jgi:hypothetical protein
MDGIPNYKSVSIGPEETPDYSTTGGYWSPPTLSDEDRNEQIKKAIKHLLGGAKAEVAEMVAAEGV